MSCRLAHLVALFTELFYMQVRFQLGGGGVTQTFFIRGCAILVLNIAPINPAALPGTLKNGTSLFTNIWKLPPPPPGGFSRLGLLRVEVWRINVLKSRLSRICDTFLHVLFTCTFIHSIVDVLTHL